MNDRQVVNSPSWSPDGSKIVYASLGDVWTVNEGGRNPTRLTWRAAVTGPAWSPDGSRIASADWGNAQEDIHVMDARGEADELGDRVTDHPGRDMSPA